MVDSSGVPQEFFHQVYEGTPAWEVGKPQPEFVRLADSGEIKGEVLDIGCGTGELAIYLAQKGLEVCGVDLVPAAIEKARQKAQAAGVAPTFHVLSALELNKLNRSFDVVIDSGLFHVFSDADRPRYVESILSVIRSGGRYFLLCFSERETAKEGPRRVTQKEIHDLFGPCLTIDSIQEARYASNVHEGGARCWLAQMSCERTLTS